MTRNTRRGRKGHGQAQKRRKRTPGRDDDLDAGKRYREILVGMGYIIRAIEDVRYEWDPESLIDLLEDVGLYEESTIQLDLKAMANLDAEGMATLAKTLALYHIKMLAEAQGDMDFLKRTEMARFEVAKGPGPWVPLGTVLPYFQIMFLGFLQKALKVLLTEEMGVELHEGKEAILKAGRGAGGGQRDRKGRDALSCRPGALLKMTRAAMMFYMQWHETGSTLGSTRDDILERSHCVYAFLAASGMYDSLLNGLLSGRPVVREAGPDRDGKRWFEITEGGELEGWMTERERMPHDASPDRGGRGAGVRKDGPAKADADGCGTAGGMGGGPAIL
jgi:hypothetical protein